MAENKKNLGDNDCLMYRPFQAENECNIYIKRDHYSTSLDPRGYIPGKHISSKQKKKEKLHGQKIDLSLHNSLRIHH
jgi:hypothetical protein